MSSIRQTLSSRLEKRFHKWIVRQIPATEKITLNRRIIFILPSRHGMTFVVAIGLIFIAAINYAISLAFGLAFLMTSIFVLTILYSFNNLNQLVVMSLPCSPVFCGEDAEFPLLLSRRSDRSHEALDLNFPDATVSRADLSQHSEARVCVYLKTHKRGELIAPRVRITTYYPLGLCRAWSVVDLNMHCLVYPKPVPVSITQLTNFNSGKGDSVVSRNGSEDYYGLRSYVTGDSMRQVAWKNMARGQGMQVKQFVEYVDDKIWLDWDMFYGFPVEERLSRLCFCVLKLARADATFGLKMPGVEIAPDKGYRHRTRLLEVLARYGNPKED
jgi:uncharacterized protein (DUF58 family)